MKIWLRSVRGAPRGIETGLGSTFDAKEIHSPDGRRIKVKGEAAQGNGEFSGPDF